jgi:hypothetical protein
MLFVISSEQRLHHTPYTTDFAECHTHLTEVLAARAPVIIGNSQ